MPPLTLVGDTLGERHHNLNKLVDNAISNNKQELTQINFDETDVENLMKIDIASRKKNVEYILEVFKCEDMLYVSRALKRCRWLVTDPQYAHIINPNYLHTHLFPYMSSKAVNKLLLHIKLNLKEENRVEEFYDYIKEHDGDKALKWLQNCSIDFVEKVFKNITIPLPLYKRLCKRSFNFIKYYTNVKGSHSTILTQVAFLLKNHTEEYLDFLDTLTVYQLPKLDKKLTEIIMKKYPDRIINNFSKYAGYVDLSILAKYLKKKDIKEFLFEHMKNKNLKFLMTNYDVLKHFIKCMPKEDRFDFVKRVFIDRTEMTDYETEVIMYCPQDVSAPSITMSYRWYQYAPFNVAFHDLKKLIRTESSPSQRSGMFAVMLNASRRDPQHLHTVLQYYHDKHINEPYKFKIQFVNNVLSQKCILKLEDKTWKILNTLFYSVEVYAESDKNVQICVKAIILYNVINGIKVPEIIEKKFMFDTFKDYQSKLNEEQREKIYNYLLEYILKKLHGITIDDESQLEDNIDILENTMHLLKDWKKDLSDYPFVIKIIQQLISIKEEKSWDIDLSSLYDFNKKWRRQLFTESLSLSCSEETCLNALKHEPQMLARHSEELQLLRTDNDILLRRLLSKLRIYWPHTIAQEWTGAYLEQLNETSGHKALITGLFTLIPQKKAIEFAKKYVPEETKINWVDADQILLNIRKNIAKHLHFIRPLPHLDVVLWYAKGNYMQYAVPSLNAILHNMSKTRARKYIPNLLDAPVSLQKYGVSLAFNKLEHVELKPMFLNIWKTTKNSTIRALLFTYTHNMLCKVEDPSDAKQTWDVLNTFIDNLSNDENKIIYTKLGQVKNVHISIRGEYYIKSYKFLSSLPGKNNCQSIVGDLVAYASVIMDILDFNFVAGDLLANAADQFCTLKWKWNDLLASFLLHGNSDTEQLNRFDTVLVPIMDRAFQSWDKDFNDDYLVKKHFNDLASSLAWYYKALMIQKKIQGAAKLFGAIKNKFEENFPTNEKYFWYTYWKLIETYAKFVEENKSILDTKEFEIKPKYNYHHKWIPGNIEKEWYDMHKKVAPLIGPMYVQYLKEDVEKYFPSIYSVFLGALREMFKIMLSQNILMVLNTLENMLGSPDFIPSYLLLCEVMPTYGSMGSNEIRIKVLKILSSHPSEEVQLHFMRAFRSIVLNIDKNE